MAAHPSLHVVVANETILYSRSIWNKMPLCHTRTMYLNLMFSFFSFTCILSSLDQRRDFPPSFDVYHFADGRRRSDLCSASKKILTMRKSWFFMESGDTWVVSSPLPPPTPLNPRRHIVFVWHLGVKSTRASWFWKTLMRSTIAQVYVYV